MGGLASVCYVGVFVFACAHTYVDYGAKVFVCVCALGVFRHAVPLTFEAPRSRSVCASRPGFKCNFVNLFPFFARVRPHDDDGFPHPREPTASSRVEAETATERAKVDEIVQCAKQRQRATVFRQHTAANEKPNLCRRGAA